MAISEPTKDNSAKAALPEADSAQSSDFIRDIVRNDLTEGKNGGRVHTRFPPEPNGYLHIGHAKSICLNFSLAEEFGGKCNLRFDDTNPTKEEEKYVEAIKADIQWLGFDWEDRLYFASDYFDKLYEYAVALVNAGKAYVDSLSAEEIRAYRGTLTTPGKNSPHRGRSVAENIEMLEGMKRGEFPDGAHVLRAKIDMASGNLNLRDPVMYRILHATHHRTGDTWCIYPMYDWAHGQSDSLEGVTHSICTLEFEDHRPLYDWFLESLDIHRPKQIEFARLNLTFTVLAKRKMLQLVTDGHVHGWDDPRMPTLIGLRRRGYAPETLRRFCAHVGVAKRNSRIDVALLEHMVREDFNLTSPRVMTVLRPLKVVLENYPEGRVEEFDAVNNPEDPDAGTRKVSFSRTLYIERDDFLEDPPKKYFRLSPGREVRLKHTYFIRCKEVIKNPDTGEIVELRCTYDPETRGGSAQDGRKVKGTLHWLSAEHAIDAEVRLYDRLYTREAPDVPEEGKSFIDYLNPESEIRLTGCKVEPGLARAAPGSRFQFMRHGYFCIDTKDSKPDALVFNRTVSLRDAWARLAKK